MEQEQALMIVAVHDAGFLLDTLAKVRAQWPNGIAAALTPVFDEKEPGYLK